MVKRPFAIEMAAMNGQTIAQVTRTTIRMRRFSQDRSNNASTTRKTGITVENAVLARNPAPSTTPKRMKSRFLATPLRTRTRIAVAAMSRAMTNVSALVNHHRSVRRRPAHSSTEYPVTSTSSGCAGGPCQRSHSAVSHSQAAKAARNCRKLTPCIRGNSQCIDGWKIANAPDSSQM